METLVGTDEHHGIFLLERRHLFTDLLNDSHSFVSSDHGESEGLRILTKNLGLTNSNDSSYNIHIISRKRGNEHLELNIILRNVLQLDLLSSNRIT